LSAHDQEASRCGIVALIGAPNAGKSTLLNSLVGSKISIVTHKVQTTRTRVRGIAIRERSQIIFVDTPGIFSPDRRLERAMVSAAWAGAEDADVIVLLYDANRSRLDANTQAILDGLKKRGLGCVLALNKIDLIKRERLLSLAAEFETTGLVEATFMISALQGDGLEDLLAYLGSRMPAGPWLFPEDQLSDFPLRLLAAEITREQLYLQLHQELPYALTVEGESWEQFDNGDVRIRQVIYVQDPRHKAICLGKNGKKIRSVREKSQKEIEILLGRRVHLFLHVTVRENWINDPERYRDWGLEFNA
jgi:GTP-binding protein Era